MLPSSKSLSSTKRDTLLASFCLAMVSEYTILAIISTLYVLGAPLLYMVLCVPLGFAVPRLVDSYGYIQNANDTTAIPNVV